MLRIRLDYRYIRTSLLVGLLFLMSCLDTIDLDLPRGFDESIIIQGRLVKGDPSFVSLSITRLFDFTPESLERVNVREVILTDEDGNSMELESPRIGIYELEILPGDPIVVEDNQSYKVSVLTFDGRQYESSLEPLLPVPTIDSLSLLPIERETVFTDGATTRIDSFIRLSIHTPTSAPSTGQSVGLLWEMGRIFKITDTPFERGIEKKTCYVAEDVDVASIRAFDGRSINGARLEDYFLYDQSVNFYVAEGMYFEVIQSSLSSGAYDYWRQIGEVSEREGNMFEPPAGKIITNFTNVNDPEEEVFGYFYATSTDTSRIYVDPLMVGSPRPLCPPEMLLTQSGDCAVPLCCDCLSVDRSTTELPDFWVE